MMKRSVAAAAGFAFAASAAMTSLPAYAVKTVGTASVSIVEPLSITEVSSSSFEYQNTSKGTVVGDASASLVVRGSPHTKPITAKSHSDPIMWGEFTLSGKNYAQISVSSIKNAPNDIEFSKESAQYGNVNVGVGKKQATMVDLSQPKRLRLSSAVNIKNASLTGRYQPIYTVALHYE